MINIPTSACSNAQGGISLHHPASMHREVYPYIRLLQCIRRYIPTSACFNAQEGISLHQAAPMHREVYPYISLLQCTGRYIPTSACFNAQGGVLCNLRHKFRFKELH